MSDPKPLIRHYVAVVFAGVLLFIGAIFFLVQTVRATGFSQWYWAFNTVVMIGVVALLLTSFAIERK